MAIERLPATTSSAWRVLPQSPVAPGGGRAVSTGKRRFGLSAPELAEWARFVGIHTGLNFPADRVHHLQAALNRRLDALGIESIDAYRLLLEAFQLEWVELAAELTVGETSFFRQPEVFQALSDDLLVDILERKRRLGSAVRIWSAGCSTGEEAWSLGIVLDEMSSRHAETPFSILGTDISHQAIARARHGEYQATRLASLNDKRRKGYFARHGDGAGLRINQRLRGHVTFRVHNLAGQDWPSGKFDLIVCQNVLIYLLPELREHVISRFYRSLAPDGYLIIGPTEIPVDPLPDGIRPAARSGILVYCRSQGGADGIAGRP